ncbi:MAG TPA: oligosaccharide flippase family protein [Gemmatimonadales bacterium]|jgi:PST family polysaccharide transporter|nr:oligosaccharide flippase family protein [Gemmatimonadales bacterium]
MRLGKTRRDLLIAFVSQFWFKVLGFGLLALLARQLSQADYGKLMFALTLCGITVLVTDLGASTDLSRRVAAAPAGARRRLEAVLSARLPLIVAYLVLLPAWVALTKRDALAVAAAIAVYSVCKDIYRTYSSFFLGLHQIGYTVTAFGASLVVLLAGVAAGVLTGAGLAWMTGAHVLSGLVLLGVAAATTRFKVGVIHLRCGWRRMQRVFGESVWLFVLSIAGMVHFAADTVMLGYLQPYEQVARYQAAAKLLEASQFVVRPLTLILLPVCAALAARQQWGELRQLMHKMFAGMAVLGVAAWAFVALLALPIIRIVYTSSYDESAELLRVLYLSVPGLYVATVAMLLASSTMREKRAVFIMGLGVVLNVALNLIAIPRYGALGAAWVTVASQSFIGVWLISDAYQSVARHPQMLLGPERQLETAMALRDD